MNNKSGNVATAAYANTSTSSTATVSSSTCGCGCQHHEPQEGCCKLTCFERPKYFCGQLLSDSDLTLQQTYIREKMKLHHRTLDGFGVVCGLRMRCDGDCKGHITIGDGYAIDCCGNDLVVCESRDLDVIGELRKKHWLVEVPADCDDRHKKRERPLAHEDKSERDADDRDCLDKQCFYIGVCYAEEPLEFAAPYTSDCSPAPGPCQPTRIREGVRFEIYDELPVRPSPLDEIAERIECCFRIFSTGQFSRGLEQLAPRILHVLGFEERDEFRDQGYHAHGLFQTLQAQFLHELRTCPDPYNCNLEEEVCRLRAPQKTDDQEGPPPLEAFNRLFALIQKYVFTCVLAQFAFPCREPNDPCCVLIGSVEIENGKLTRVINYPRWYLLCFVNFFEVLLYTLANDAACARHERPGQREQQDNEQKEGCCPDFEVDIRKFLFLFQREKRAAVLSGLAPVNAVRAIFNSLVSGFDFMKPGGIVGQVFEKMDPKEAAHVAEVLGLEVERFGGESRERQDPITALLANLVYRNEDHIALFENDDRVTGATRVIKAPASPVSATDAMSNDDSRSIKRRIKEIEKDLRDLKNSLRKVPESQKGEASGQN